jgi:hypothetical protein
MITLLIGTNRPGSNTRKIARQVEEIYAQLKVPLHVLDLASGDTKRISNGTGKTTCAFFRPGTDEIEFASTHADPNIVLMAPTPASPVKSALPI